MITIRHKGSFRKTQSYFKKLLSREQFAGIEALAQAGVAALSSATPVNTGNTANSWYYVIEEGSFGVRVIWKNSVSIQGTPLVILLQYGHGTGTGGYVQGRDFINPAIEPIFNRIAEEVWKVVTSA